ncbi:MAG: hypothetical protein KAI44_03570, partial [Methylococcales bacterium]|nr:hypothetical protein [Methylococcales bacterium]
VISCTFLGFTLLLLSSHNVTAGQLDDFSSDGCSQFPDGTLAQENLWCDCCITHDIAYWQGGNREQKKQADSVLRECVLQKTGNSILAGTMYYGVTLGGSPVFPTWYRWGYGWRYGRGFQSLDQYEKQQVKEKLQYYRLIMPQSSCDFEHPVKVKTRENWQKLMDKLD